MHGKEIIQCIIKNQINIAKNTSYLPNSVGVQCSPFIHVHMRAFSYSLDGKINFPQHYDVASGKILRQKHIHLADVCLIEI
jgi:hypothetical protein